MAAIVTAHDEKELIWELVAVVLHNIEVTSHLAHIHVKYFVAHYCINGDLYILLLCTSIIKNCYECHFELCSSSFTLLWQWQQSHLHEQCAVQ